MVKIWNLNFFVVLHLTGQIDLGSTCQAKIDRSWHNLEYPSVPCLSNTGAMLHEMHMSFGYTQNHTL